MRRLSQVRQSKPTERYFLIQFQDYYASNVLLYLSLASSKVAVAFLVLAIKPKRWIAITLNSLIVIIILWGFGAILTVALQCQPTRWVLGPTSADTCIDQYSGLIGLRVVDIVTDVALSILPAAMVSGVQMPLSKRLVVAFMFALRLVYVRFVHGSPRANNRISTPVVTAISLSSYSAFYSSSTRERSFTVVQPSVWTSIALNLSLTTACLPSIKRWLTDWAAGVANAGIMEPYELQHSSGHDNTSRSGYTSGLRSFGKSRSRSHDVSRPDKETPTMDIRYGREHDPAVGDDGDSKKGLTDGILQTVDYHVEYEHDRYRL